MDLTDLYLNFVTQANPRTEAHLPPLITLTQHDHLLTTARQWLLTNPAQGWRLANLVAQGSQQLGPSAVAAAHFQAAWCAAEWMRPERVNASLSQAEPYFEAQQAHSWLAACQWVRLAHPWILTGWSSIKQQLKRLLPLLAAQPDTRHLLPHAQLAYAYSLMLTGDKQAFLYLNRRIATEPDLLLRGRFFQCRSALLRRGVGLPQARRDKQLALDLYREAGSKVDLARGRVLAGLLAWQADIDCPTAVAHFDAALETFTALEIEPWTALTRANRAQVLRVQGRLSAAARDLQAAQDVYLRYAIVGSLADSHIDAGLVELEMGDTDAAEAHLFQAQALADQLGPQNYLHPLAKIYRARVFQVRGDVQAALQLLEATAGTEQDKKNFAAASEAFLDLARLWLQLDSPTAAKAALDHARTAISRSQRAIYQLRLQEMTIRVAQVTQTGEVLEKQLHAGLETAEKLGHIPYSVRFLRFLGEHMVAADRPAEAQAAIERGLALAVDSELMGDVTLLLLLQGELYQRQGRIEAARTAFENGLELTAKRDRAVRARLHSALAGVVATEEALAHDLEALRHWAAVRQGFFQPWLASGYAAATEALQAALMRGLAHGELERLLTLIELSKGGALQHRLRHRAEEALTAVPNAELATRQQAVYAWLPEIQASSSWRTKLRLQNEQIAALRTYHALLDQRERALRKPRLVQLQTLNLSVLRLQLSDLWGKGWVALDYHLLDKEVLCLILTEGELHLHRSPLPPQADEMRHAAHPTKTARKHAAAWSTLLPPDLISTYLGGANTPLIISPNGWLHHLPWPALPVPEQPADRPLVSCCLPIVTPSLHILQLLSGLGVSPARQAGMVISVPEFMTGNGRQHPPLPHAAREGAGIVELHAGQPTHLRPPNNRLRVLQQHHASGRLQEVDWLHLATHAFFNARLNGRACGFALADRDLWLADLEALAPLPPRVLLSACSGIPVEVFAGDELVGLGISCLAAGAHTMVGNLWNIADEVAADLMLEVHRQWMTERPLAEAVARAQRQAWQAKRPLSEWGGLQVFGLGI